MDIPTVKADNNAKMFNHLVILYSISCSFLRQKIEAEGTTPIKLL